MFAQSDSRASRFLVAWYGLYQLGHILVNAAYLLNPGVPPFASPPGGWIPQTVAFLNGMAAGDLVNAVLSVVFVIGFLCGARWSAWLGTLTLTISIYAAIVFTYGLWAAGAFDEQMSEYLWVYLPFIPVALLFFVWFYWLIGGKIMIVRDGRSRGK